MSLAKLSLIFKIIIIAIIYIIIFFALRIMYKDIKNGGKKKVRRKTYGLEILAPGNNQSLKKGGVIPIRGEITIGRKSENMLILDDLYVSAYHAKVYVKNANHIIEDLGSTNGTLINGSKISGKVTLKSGDEIQIGSTKFRVIG
ncbi:FHA domain-containing protein FhaB [Clostridium acetireducens DSM 10703]|jgi:pSer/pThr/pTyr-binding forkhead associated (FHA) protein|uniref:FHA domain-containing protein FhaB n=1 Tax=Clostridium acetireducens DSM 10703 TaxID=1121290 RepID=A0A1E8F1L6_9CLOT|nr:FHA domain-containing protein [Clostridium acetireducens]OFI07497.1 FHA domain-containing protein FhaB [Clostridium acetireducens DSM 10703]